MVQNAIRDVSNFVNTIKNAISSINIDKQNPENTTVPENVDVSELSEKLKSMFEEVQNAKGDYTCTFNSVSEVKNFLEGMSSHCKALLTPSSAGLNLCDMVCKKWNVFEFAIMNKVDPDNKFKSEKELVNHMNNKCKLIWAWFSSLFEIAKDVGGICGRIGNILYKDCITLEQWVYKHS